jgi:hypothetical protein
MKEPKTGRRGPAHKEWVKSIYKRLPKDGRPIVVKVESGISTFPSAESLRKLAAKLNRSPSHICRVINGERESKRLSKELKKLGIKVKGAK